MIHTTRDAICATALVGGVALAYYFYQQRGTRSHHLSTKEQQVVASKLKPDSILEKELAILKKEFDHNYGTLVYIQNCIMKEMQEGLESHDSESSLKMIPTFITSLPTGEERGSAYALDIGGSNLRVIQVLLNGGGKMVQAEDTVKMEIPVSAQQGTGVELFDFIADAVARLTKDKQVPLGFTFSFPIDQIAINAGTLIKWTKNFSASGVVGEDVVGLLHAAFNRKQINVTVNAMVNDTVGTLLAGCYETPAYDCCIGMILGTGTNTCFVEKMSNIKKMVQKEAEHMIMNMESGNFGSRPGKIGDHLPLTEYDRSVNDGSLNKNHQIFEKQASGMYLGEILRYIIRKQMTRRNIFQNYDNAFLKPYSLPTEDLSTMADDSTQDLVQVRKVLEKHGIIQSELDERTFVKEAGHLVARRSAQIATTKIVAILKHLGKENKDNIVVAIDGSLFEKYPRFDQMMQETAYTLLGHRKISFRLTKDGSGVGAALASYMRIPGH